MEKATLHLGKAWDLLNNLESLPEEAKGALSDLNHVVEGADQANGYIDIAQQPFKTKDRKSDTGSCFSRYDPDGTCIFEGHKADHDYTLVAKDDSIIIRGDYLGTGFWVPLLKEMKIEATKRGVDLQQQYTRKQNIPIINSPTEYTLLGNLDPVGTHTWEFLTLKRGPYRYSIGYYGGRPVALVSEISWSYGVAATYRFIEEGEYLTNDGAYLTDKDVANSEEGMYWYVKDGKWVSLPTCQRLPKGLRERQHLWEDDIFEAHNEEGIRETYILSVKDATRIGFCTAEEGLTRSIFGPMLEYRATLREDDGMMDAFTE